MKKTTALLASLAAATTSLAAADSANPQSAIRNPQSPKPNIIFILCDDLGYGDIGVFFQNARRDANDPARPWHTTPNIDRMAAEGAKLTDHYCATPVCVSSRSSLITGLTQGHIDVRDNQFDKAIPDNHTIATVLHQAGYTTAAFGKWGLFGNAETNGNTNEGKPASNKTRKTPKDPVTEAWIKNTNADWPAHPLNRGFDYYYGMLRHVDGHEHYPKEQVYFHEKSRTRGPLRVWENHADVTNDLDKCYTTDLWTARAKQWIIDHQKNDPAQPFFIYLAYDTPHAVLELPPCPFPEGRGLHGGVQWLGTPGHMINTATGTPDTYIDPQYANATSTRDGKEQPWPNVYKRYATDINRIDNCVGDLLQLLKDLNIDDNTLVIFTSDNGPSIESYLPEDITPQFFSSYGLFDGIKRDEWEGGLRVPAIAHWTGHIPAGSAVTAPVAMFDWLPTFAEAAQLPAPPAKADGKSLLGNLLGHPAADSRGDGKPDDYIYTEYYFKGSTPDFPEFEPSHRNRVRDQMQAIRQGDIMAVRYDVKTAQDPFELYNVRTDPKEAHNLASTPEGAAMQAHFQTLAPQSRRPEPSAPRPYDNDPMPASPAPAQTVAGLTWSYYEGNFPWTPNCANLTAQATGRAPVLTLASVPVPPGGGKNAAVVYQGYLKVPADGDYVFAASTDTGLIMRLHQATIIDADFGYTSGAMRTSDKVRLKAGLHPITLTYHTDGKTASALNLTWSGPGMTAQHAFTPADFVSSSAHPWIDKMAASMPLGNE